MLYSLTCNSFISSFSLRTGNSRQSSNNASIRLTEESNLSMLVTSGSISTSGADDGWLKRCENNLVTGVDVFRCKICPVPDGSDNGGNVLSFRVLGGCDCDFFESEMDLSWCRGSKIDGDPESSCLVEDASGDCRLDSSSESPKRSNFLESSTSKIASYKSADFEPTK